MVWHTRSHIPRKRSGSFSKMRRCGLRLAVIVMVVVLIVYTVSQQWELAQEELVHKNFDSTDHIKSDKSESDNTRNADDTSDEINKDDEHFKGKEKESDENVGEENQMDSFFDMVQKFESADDFIFQDIRQVYHKNKKLDAEEVDSIEDNEEVGEYENEEDIDENGEENIEIDENGEENVEIDEDIEFDSNEDEEIDESEIDDNEDEYEEIDENENGGEEIDETEDEEIDETEDEDEKIDENEDGKKKTRKNGKNEYFDFYKISNTKENKNINSSSNVSTGINNRSLENYLNDLKNNIDKKQEFKKVYKYFSTNEDGLDKKSIVDDIGNSNNFLGEFNEKNRNIKLFPGEADDTGINKQTGSNHDSSWLSYFGLGTFSPMSMFSKDDANSRNLDEKIMNSERINPYTTIENVTTRNINISDNNLEYHGEKDVKNNTEDTIVANFTSNETGFKNDSVMDVFKKIGNVEFLYHGNTTKTGRYTGKNISLLDNASVPNLFYGGNAQRPAEDAFPGLNLKNHQKIETYSTSDTEIKDGTNTRNGSSFSSFGQSILSRLSERLPKQNSQLQDNKDVGLISPQQEIRVANLQQLNQVKDKSSTIPEFLYPSHQTNFQDQSQQKQLSANQQTFFSDQNANGFYTEVSENHFKKIIPMNNNAANIDAYENSSKQRLERMSYNVPDQSQNAWNLEDKQNIKSNDYSSQSLNGLSKTNQHFNEREIMDLILNLKRETERLQEVQRLKELLQQHIILQNNQEQRESPMKQGFQLQQSERMNTVDLLSTPPSEQEHNAINQNLEQLNTFNYQNIKNKQQNLAQESKSISYQNELRKGLLVPENQIDDEKFNKLKEETINSLPVDNTVEAHLAVPVNSEANKNIAKNNRITDTSALIKILKDKSFLNSNLVYNQRKLLQVENDEKSDLDLSIQALLQDSFILSNLLHLPVKNVERDRKKVLTLDLLNSYLQRDETNRFIEAVNFDGLNENSEDEDIEVPLVFDSIIYSELKNDLSNEHDISKNTEPTNDQKELVLHNVTPYNGISYDNPNPLSDEMIKAMNTPAYDSFQLSRNKHNETDESDIISLSSRGSPNQVHNIPLEYENGSQSGSYSWTTPPSFEYHHVTPMNVLPGARLDLEDVKDCPRYVRHAKTAGPVTALVIFPGEASVWVRRVLEMLTGVETDSIYHVMSLVKTGEMSAAYHMNRKLAIQTHSDSTKIFDRAIVVLSNPFVVEQKHRHFRPKDIDWRRDFLWGPTYAAWLRSDLPKIVTTVEDLVETPMTELIKLARFLKTEEMWLDIPCACQIVENPPRLERNVTKISGIYSDERRRVNQEIDNVAEYIDPSNLSLLERVQSYKYYLVLKR